MSFLSAPSIRQILAVPTQDRIDFRAACFCHKNIIDIGFVCSVCLSSKSSLGKFFFVFEENQFSVNLCLFVQRAGQLTGFQAAEF